MIYFLRLELAVRRSPKWAASRSAASTYSDVSPLKNLRMLARFTPVSRSSASSGIRLLTIAARNGRVILVSGVVLLIVESLFHIRRWVSSHFRLNIEIRNHLGALRVPHAPIYAVPNRKVNEPPAAVAIPPRR